MGLTVTDVAKSYEGRSFLSGVSMTLQQGEVLGLGGASGAGKSTLARIMAGHIRADRGQVRLDDKPLLPLGTGTSPVQYAPQSAELACDPRWRVRDVLCNGGVPDAAVLEALGIRTTWADRRPQSLSGGELARVSLARLLGPQTRFLICDEITAQLDALAQARLWPLLLGVARARGIGVLVISHDARLRSQICRRNLVLGDGQISAEVPAGRDVIEPPQEAQGLTDAAVLQHCA
jgi:ABC-type dipeptide/oligopeptide/nickel transport system ATPase subunit